LTAGRNWVWVGPLIIALVSLPLALNLIAPNPFYGIRISATAASEAAWYRGNQAGGIAGILAGVLVALANHRVSRTRWSGNRKLVFFAGSMVLVALLIGFAGTVFAD